MEAELNVLRTAAANRFRGSQSLESVGTQVSPTQQLASPAPSGGSGVNCETCVVGKDCACFNAINETVVVREAVPLRPRAAKVEVTTEEKEDSCGLCSSTSCICEKLGLRTSETSHEVTEPPPRSPTPSSLKRKRSHSPPTTPLLPTAQTFPMEIDFTSSFTNTLSPESRRQELPNGGCGFCSDGTPCVCLQNTLPPLLSNLNSIVPEAHPEAIRRGAGRRSTVDDVKIVGGAVPRVGSPMTIASGKSGCTGVPGTQSNTLFTTPPTYGF
jgi:hypothetical protein